MYRILADVTVSVSKLWVYYCFTLQMHWILVILVVARIDGWPTTDN